MTDGWTDGRRRLQYPRGFLKKHGNNYALLLEIDIRLIKAILLRRHRLPSGGGKPVQFSGNIL